MALRPPNDRRYNATVSQDAPPRILRASDRTLLVSFGNAIAPELTRQVHRLASLLRAERIRGVLDWHPGYSSVLIRFDPLSVRFAEQETIARDLVSRLGHVVLEAPRLVEIPVAYGGEFGPDLAEVARLTGLPEDAVVRRHAAPTYDVCFIGFTAGFPYLSGLDPSLATPRLAFPRKRVPAGSVAIGGAQTGIYPLASPGGWRLIGRTPLSIFDPDREPVALLRAGDRARFIPVPREEWPRQ